MRRYRRDTTSSRVGLGSPQRRVHPDLMVFDSTDEQTRLTAIPHLAVEILSTDRARDMIRKARKYAAAGLERYWIIDPGEPGEVTAGGEPELIEYRAVDGVLVEQDRISPGTEATLDVGPTTVTFDPAELLN